MRLCSFGSPEVGDEFEANRPPRQYCFTTWRARLRKHRHQVMPSLHEVDPVQEEAAAEHLLSCSLANETAQAQAHSLTVESPLCAWLRTSGCGWDRAVAHNVEAKLGRVGISTVAQLEAAVKDPCKLNAQLRLQREPAFKQDTLDQFSTLFEEARQKRDWDEKVDNRRKQERITGVHLVASPCRRRQDSVVAAACTDEWMKADVQDLESFISCSAPMDPDETYVTAEGDEAVAAQPITPVLACIVDENDNTEHLPETPLTPLPCTVDRSVVGQHLEATGRRQSLPPMPARSVCEVSMPLPPSSESWDWPLSRVEKKSRITMLDHNVLMTDRFELTEIARRLAQEVEELREGKAK